MIIIYYMYISLYYIIELLGFSNEINFVNVWIESNVK